jgi:Uma2 family endonuclease
MISGALLPEPSVAPSARDEPLYEVVGGQIKEVPPMGAHENTMATDLAYFLLAHVKPNKLGRVAVETLFVLDKEKNLKRRPDVAFVSYARWPRSRRVPRTDAWDVVPELAVEIVSTSNSADEIVDKISEYFKAGCQRVWVIYPTQEQIYVYRSPTQNTILAMSDELDGESILPGFRLPLACLFERDEE